MNGRLKLWQGVVLALAATFLFSVANRGAYEGYFTDDDLDNLGWTHHAQGVEFAKGLVSPLQYANNYRPVGHVAYRILGSLAGLEFGWYVIFIHVVHGLNAWLLWLVLRRLGAPLWSTGAAVLFFAFHMAAFDAYWKPMYLFDLLCGLFCLLALLAYLRGHWLLAFIPFWLAYKSKELAVMLPLVFLTYELLLGQRRWKRVLAFMAVSAFFGVQAILGNRTRQDDYTLRFTLEALWTCASFYASKVLLLPYLGFLFVPLALVARNRTVRFGLATALLFLAPLLFLPGRLFGVYLYVPLLGLAVALAFVIPRARWAPAAIIVAFVPWLMLNYYFLRQQRRVWLSEAPLNRAYVAGVAEFARQHPDHQLVVLDGRPESLNIWGARGAFRWYLALPDERLPWVEDLEVQQALKEPRIAVASWDRTSAQLRMLVRDPETPDASFVSAGRFAPLWQLGTGWFLPEAHFRWMHPVGRARLGRSATATGFEVTVNMSELQIKDQGRVSVEPLLAGKSLGVQWIDRRGWITLRWPVPPGLPETVDVELRAPPYRSSNGDPRTFGVAVASFGFVER